MRLVLVCQDTLDPLQIADPNVLFTQSVHLPKPVFNSNAVILVLEAVELTPNATSQITMPSVLVLTISLEIHFQDVIPNRKWSQL